MPGLLVREGDLADISQICRLEGGKRLVSIISAANLFHHSSVKEALKSVENLRDDEHGDASVGVDDEATDDDEQVVVFRLDKEEFGVPIDSVQEIVRVPEELTHIPRAPSFVEGVINLLGAVLNGTANPDDTRQFGSLWQERVARILIDHGEDHEIVALRPCANSL